jgi:broad specificity phosphatase PhoE/predicted kinase
MFYVIRGRKKDRGNVDFTERNLRNFHVVEDEASAILDSSVHSDNSPTSGGTWTTLGLERPMVIAMVGLPARGKSYIVKMMIRYFSWTGLVPQVFNVGAYRREIGLRSADSNFFSSSNSQAKQVREDMAMKVQDVMYKWLHAQGGEQRVAIFDATNTTKSRRLSLCQRAKRENVFLLFVESICDDEEVLMRNYELKLQNEDYKNMDKAKAKADFIDRVRAYEQQYETIEDDEDNFDISYIKLVNVGQKVISRNCFGYLPSQVAFYLQNVHIQPRKIYLSLNAETFGTKEGEKLHISPASNAPLTDAGRDFSLNLARLITASNVRNKMETDPRNFEMLVLAGTSKVNAETILHLRMVCPCFNTPLLNELRAGDLQGLSSEDIKRDFPDEYSSRQIDKLRYRYPGVGGESYLDVIERIRPVIIELERQRRSVLVVCHLAVLRCIYAYFSGTKIEEIPFLPITMHEVIELEPGPFGCKIRVIDPYEELSHM